MAVLKIGFKGLIVSLVLTLSFPILAQTKIACFELDSRVIGSPPVIVKFEGEKVLVRDYDLLMEFTSVSESALGFNSDTKDINNKKINVSNSKIFDLSATSGSGVHASSSLLLRMNSKEEVVSLHLARFENEIYPYKVSSAKECEAFKPLFNQQVAELEKKQRIEFASRD